METKVGPRYLQGALSLEQRSRRFRAQSGYRMLQGNWTRLNKTWNDFLKRWRQWPIHATHLLILGFAFLERHYNFDLNNKDRCILSAMSRRVGVNETNKKKGSAFNSSLLTLSCSIPDAAERRRFPTYQSHRFPTSLHPQTSAMPFDLDSHWIRRKRSRVVFIPQAWNSPYLEAMKT